MMNPVRNNMADNSLKGVVILLENGMVFEVPKSQLIHVQMESQHDVKTGGKETMIIIKLWAPSGFDWYAIGRLKDGVNRPPEQLEGGPLMMEVHDDFRTVLIRRRGSLMIEGQTE